MIARFARLLLAALGLAGLVAWAFLRREPKATAVLYGEPFAEPWGESWEASERRADADIAAGRVRSFATADGFRAWLAAPDDGIQGDAGLTMRLRGEA